MVSTLSSISVKFTTQNSAHLAHLDALRAFCTSLIINLFLGIAIVALESFWLHCLYHIAELLAKRRCLTLPEELPIIYLGLFEGMEHGLWLSNETFFH